MKPSFLDNRITVNVSAFWNGFKHLQEASNFLLPNGSSLSLIQNAGTARARGVELGTGLRLNDYVSLTADLARLDAKYTSFPNSPCAPSQTLSTPNCRQDLSGALRPFAAKYSGNVALAFSLPTRDGPVSCEPRLHFTSRYTQQVNNDPIFDQPGFAKLDARLTYSLSDRRWDIAPIVKNLTDETTASFRNVLPNFGSVFALFDRPGSVALQFTLRH